MPNIFKKRTPVREGLFISPSNPSTKPQLIAGQCLQCGETVFPTPMLCPNCQNENIAEVQLSRKGKIYSCTVVMQQPRPYYKGPVPYGLGFVELPEGVRIETLFTDCDPDSLHIGMEVELVIEKLYEDDQGQELITYKFRPVRS